MLDTLYRMQRTGAWRQTSWPKALLRRYTTPRYAYLGDHMALVRLYDGSSMFIDTHDLGVGAQIIQHGCYEPHIERTIRELVKPGQTCLDVGAYLGYHTLTMAGLVGNNGKVIAVEPQQRALDMLWHSALLNGLDHRIIAKRYAAGVTEGQVAFHAQTKWGGASYVFHEAVPAEGVEGFEKTIVPQRRLDAILEDAGVARLDLMKIDVEGYEPLALQGLGKFAEMGRLRIIMEWSAPQIACFSPLQDFATRIAALGFRCEEIAADGSRTARSTSDLMTLSHTDLLLSRG